MPMMVSKCAYDNRNGNEDENDEEILNEAMISNLACDLGLRGAHADISSLALKLSPAACGRYWWHFVNFFGCG